uniref:Epidermal patterning factor-like protein n=1 Tax=Oryza punctata TaxID=4537 RepID=A0A0E0MPY1_ORYPU
MGSHRNALLLQLLLLLAAAAITTHLEMMEGAAAVATGSRPPSCEGMCSSSCGGHCQAVQVPVTPSDLLLNTTTTTTASSPRRTAQLKQKQAAEAYDDHSNYKPLSWRCKCRLNS